MEFFDLSLELLNRGLVLRDAGRKPACLGFEKTLYVFVLGIEQMYFFFQLVQPGRRTIETRQSKRTIDFLSAIRI